jgi:hypothetical protein
MFVIDASSKLCKGENTTFPRLLSFLNRIMSEPVTMSLTLTQKFEIEKMSRVIDDCNDVPRLKELTKQILVAYETQKACSKWAYAQVMGIPVAQETDEPLDTDLE